MRVPARAHWAGLLAAAGVAGLLVWSATAAGAQGSPPPGESAAAALSARAALTAGSASGTRHFNVGNTHSPRLEKQLAGPSGSGIYSPAQSPIAGAVQGIDVSSAQEQYGITWPDVANDNIQFAAIKGTEGDYYKNKYALADLAAAKAAGLSVMAYAFAIPNGDGSSASPVTQANDLISYLQTGTAGVPPIMLDIEYDPNVSQDKTNSCYGLSQPAMVTWIKQFGAQIQAKTGSLPLIYSTADWWKTCTGDSTALGEAPLWIAQYGSVTSPALPAGWKSWDFWQYSSTGTVSGITGNVDLDQLHPSSVPLLNPGDQLQAAGAPVDMQVSTADPIAGETLSYTASGLPGGLSLDAATGRITGWISRPGTYQSTVTATDSQGDLGSATFGWTVSAAPVQAAGELNLDLAGKCLNDVGDKSASGTQASIWTCNGSDAEQWSYYQDETLRIHGKCLSVSSGAADGSKPGLQACNTYAGQRWRIVYPRGENPSAGATAIGFLNVGTGKCLADPGSSKTNGTRVVISACDGGHDQAWRLPAGPLRSQIGGKCADDKADNTADGAVVDLWTCNGGGAQNWLTWFGGELAVNGKCLTVTGGATAAGTPAELSTCGTSAAQQWRLTPAGNGVSLMNPQSGLCLADPGDTVTNGTQLQILTCDASDPGTIWRAS
jgi:GH25 family lysozyme M1 (1,4-beta-N-acetylmuramidase)